MVSSYRARAIGEACLVPRLTIGLRRIFDPLAMLAGLVLSA
jgi:hypothetical protein